METPHKIFIGYDSREISAYHVCVQSILDHASEPIAIIPLKKELLPMYNRTDGKGTTEFSLTRFLVPYLSEYKGWSLFMDCDMVVKFDICTMFKDIQLLDTNTSVFVVKHNYLSKITTKATGKNENYPMKNWSSVMMFNNTYCESLTPKLVNSSKPSFLHRFGWANFVGELPMEYNWLVEEYEHNDHAKILHYTLGSPCFKEWSDCDHAEDWYGVYLKLHLE